MLENIIRFAPDEQSRKRCLRMFAFMQQQLDAWPFGGSIHSQTHWSRVCVLTQVIGIHEGFSETDLEAVAWAAAFHDSRRNDPFLDHGHGARAAEHYRTFCEEHGLTFDPRAALAMHWHDLDDQEGLQAVREWDADNKPEPGWNVGAEMIFLVLCDADGLDRMRMFEKALDLKYLRLDYSKTLKPFALELLAASQCPGTQGAPDEQGTPRDYLVVIDVQNDFVSGSLGSAEAQAALPSMVEKVRSFDGQVVFTKDTHDESYLQTQEGRKLPVEHCLVDTWGWELVDELDAIQKEQDLPVYIKGTFGSPELARDLEKAYARGNLASVEFIGLCTDICVVSNAMLVKAQMPELTVKVSASCCAGVTPELHNAALQTMASCQIEVI